MTRDRIGSEHARAGAVDTVVIGAGHAGLAMSRCLTERGINHVVLERGEVANSWKYERWDSLRLLTPNWQNRLPGCDGKAFASDTDPEGFMTTREVIAYIESYAAAVAAPIRNHTTVTSVRRDAKGYRVVTNRGEWTCRALVIASGICNIASVPRIAKSVPATIETLTCMEYRNPHSLSDGGVLVVGASATGLQLAHEIHRSGRPVTLAVGEHVRMPRRYRGRDIQWWLHAAGILDERIDQVDDLERARGVPSPQLIGTQDNATLDLNSLAAIGVRCVGRLAGITQDRAQFSGALRNHCAMADLKLSRLLKRIDDWADYADVRCDPAPAQRFEPTRVPDPPCLQLKLSDGAIRTIVWATGYRPDYSWLDLPVLDRKGRLRHDGGVVDSPGVYVLGLPFMRKRKSSFIFGAADDASELSDHLASYLAQSNRRSTAA